MRPGTGVVLVSSEKQHNQLQMTINLILRTVSAFYVALNETMDAILAICWPPTFVVCPTISQKTIILPQEPTCTLTYHYKSFTWPRQIILTFFEKITQNIAIFSSFMVP